ncbi:MAG: phosphatase PAP2 family protein [Ignavibacteriales bacterium]|nr:phosphatase PAP2 family protein [Ignavibacteriales bacterium]
MSFFQELDTALFFFVNHSLGNPLFDVIMPALTDLNKFRAVQVLLILGMGIAMIRGKRRARVVCLMLIVTIVCSDQLSSFAIKPIFSRLRPCWTLADVRTFVGCGSGYSFPSSHAVNNFAAATVFAFYYRTYAAAFYLFAALIAFTRIYVGVHYPSDVLGGAVIGTCVASFIIALWSVIEKHSRFGRTEPLR